MPRQIVDLAARSRVLRDQPLLSHAWVATPSEVMQFMRHPRSELKKLGIRLPAECTVETSLQNHDWLSGHSHGLDDDNGVTVYARGEGDGQQFYRVNFYAGKAQRKRDQPPLLHRHDEEEKPIRPMSPRVRTRHAAMRQSMAIAPMHPVVHQWVAPLTIGVTTTKSADEAHRVFSEIVEVVSRLAAENPDIGAAMIDVANSLQRPFNPMYANLFRAESEKATGFHQAFTGAMYLKTLQMLRRTGWQREALVADVEQLLADPGPVLQTLTETINALDPDFVGHATVDATTRRRDNAFFGDRLAEAENLFASFAPRQDEGLDGFAAPARRLEAFKADNNSQWWFLPGLVAYAMAVWPVAKQ